MTAPADHPLEIASRPGAAGRPTRSPRYLTLARRIVARIAAELDPHRLPQLIVKVASQALAADQVFLLSYDQAAGVFQTWATYSRDGSSVTNDPWPAAATFAKDGVVDPRSAPWSESPLSGACQAVTVRLRYRRTIQGAIALTRVTERPFQPADVGLLRLLGEVASAACGKSRLLAERTRLLAEISLLHRLAVIGARGSDLEATVKELVATVHASRCFGEFGLVVTPEHESELAIGDLRGLDEATRVELRLGSAGKPRLSPTAEDLAIAANHARSFVRLEGGNGAAAPLVGRAAGIMGAVVAANAPSVGFADSDAQLLRSLAGELALIVERVELLDQLREQALRDSLTQLYNHGYLLERLAEEVERGRRFGRPVAFLMLDIDSFKQFNDRYGHPVGDAILRALASVLVHEMRQVDVVGRYGGEEFGIILPDTDGTGAFRAAERIHAAVSRLGLPEAAQRERLTVSQGIATYPDDAASASDLVDLADRALLTAKRRGKNQTYLARTLLDDEIAASRAVAANPARSAQSGT